MTLNIFEQDQTDLPIIDENKDPFEVLTGPGGKFDRSKYQTQQHKNKAIAKGKVESDLFIEHLKERQDELRKDYLELRERHNAGPRLEELINQISSRTPEQSNSNAPDAKDIQPAIDPKQLEILVTSKIQEYETSKKQEENYRIVKEKLTERFGNNYQNILNKQAVELGLTPDDVNNLALNKPKVLFKALGLDEQKTEGFQSPPSSNFRSSFTPNVEVRNRTYYTKMRDEKPELYRSPKIQLQMFEDAKKLGEAFFS